MTLVELARKLRPIIEKSAQSLDDATALDAVVLFPAWAVGVAYTAGTRITPHRRVGSPVQPPASLQRY